MVSQGGGGCWFEPPAASSSPADTLKVSPTATVSFGLQVPKCACTVHILSGPATLQGPLDLLH